MMSFSRNVFLIPSQRDDWSAGSTIPSPMACDSVVAGSPRDSSNNKETTYLRTPHYLRLDDDRVVFSFCDLHSIPEDEPVCQYQQVIKAMPRNPRRRRNHAMTWEQLQPIVAQALQEEGLLEREGQPNDTQQEADEERDEWSTKVCYAPRQTIRKSFPNSSLQSCRMSARSAQATSLMSKTTPKSATMASIVG